MRMSKLLDINKYFNCEQKMFLFFYFKKSVKLSSNEKIVALAVYL
jgi:hypothetical protein